jgi:hypothetical protein
MQQEALATAVVPLEPGRRADAKPGKEGAYAHYRLGRAYDEMFTADGRVRPHYAELHRRLAELSPEELRLRQQACEQSFLHQGITFTVYGDNQATERIIPTDLLPRVITAAEWARLEAGLKQRVAGLNLFLHDIYSDGRVLKDGLVPRSMVYGSKHYLREMRGLSVPHGAYVNVCGTDLVRREDGVLRGARGQSPGAFGRLLHAGEPRCRQARVSQHIQKRGRAPHRTLSAGPARDVEVAGAIPGQRVDRRAVAGRVQLGLFRARVPGAPDGRRVGRRP